MNKEIFKWILITASTLILSLFVSINLVSIIKYNQLTLNLFSVIRNDKSIIIGSILLFILLLLVIVKYTVAIQNSIRNGSLKSAGNNEFGSSRFATNSEVEKEFKEWKLNHKLESGGMVVTKIKDKYYYDDSTNHSLIIGSTGSGKTVSAIMPLIYNLADAGESMIVNDSKGEILRETYGYLKRKGYNIKIINLREPNKSDGWNPLHLPYKYFVDKDIEKEVETVNDFSYSICQEVSARDPYWSESSSAVLSGLALALIEDSKCEEQVHFNSLYNLLVYHGSKTLDTRKNSLDDYFDSKPFGNLAKNFYATGGFAKGETRATIFSILSSKLGKKSIFVLSSIKSIGNAKFFNSPLFSPFTKMNPTPLISSPVKSATTL